MAMTWAQFSANRKQASAGGGVAQLFRAENPAAPTVMVCSHIWWTEQIALSFLNAGFNVLVHFPLYLLYTDAGAWAKLDDVWTQTLRTIRDAKVNILIGGNTSAMLVHPKSREMIHEAAGIRLVNWWWDELRTRPPLARAEMNMSPTEFWSILNRPTMTHAIWDIDVMEELADTAIAKHMFGPEATGLHNLIHLPLATLPEYWPHGYIPMAERPLWACFLGNCHFTAEWVETDDDILTQWARTAVERKINAVRTPMRTCIAESQGIPTTQSSRHMTAGREPWTDFIRPWEFLNAAWMHRTRNILVRAAEAHLKGKLALVGKGWDKLGLRANSEHAGDKSGIIYGQSQASLNLFGGCVHGGMPLRPFDIGASGGLIVTHDQRELHGAESLFEPGTECITFRTCEEMIAILDNVHTSPAEFDKVSQAGRKRVLTNHTWIHRVKHLMKVIGC